MRFFIVALFMFVSVLSAHLAKAQDGLNMPALPANAMDDNAPITLSPDGPAVIRLSEDAASVIVANPSQATAVLENPRMIILMPQQPGATRVLALDRNGKSLLDKHVLVGGGRSGFIRVNRACNVSKNANGNCQPVSMYYCPDRCYETNVPQAGTEAATVTGDAKAPEDNAPPPADVTAEAPPEAPEVPDSVGENPVAIDDGSTQ